MRLDKYLKVSRIIKRRTIAKEIVDKGCVLINEKPAKASSLVKIGDILTIKSNTKCDKYLVKNIFEYATGEKAKLMFEILE